MQLRDLIGLLAVEAAELERDIEDCDKYSPNMVSLIHRHNYFKKVVEDVLTGLGVNTDE